MIIDVHVHLFPNREIGKMVVESFRERTGAGYYSYGTPDEYLEDMRKSNIDRGVILSCSADNQILKKLNFWTVDIAGAKNTGPAKYQTLIPFISVNPTMGERAIIDELDINYKLGMKGLKIHPNVQGFSPDDGRMRPVYRWLIEHDLPISAHSGVNVVIDENTHFGEPRHWSGVLEEFPNLKLILAHMGNGFWDQAIDIAKKYKNVLFDTAAAISSFESDIKLDNDEAIEMIRTIGAGRILFGTDYPWVNPAKDIQIIMGLNISESEKRLILGENAAKLFL